MGTRSWRDLALPPTMDEATLRARMYRRVVPLSRTPRPDFAYLHEELRRRGVTRLLLWEEYKAAYPDGWQIACFAIRTAVGLATQELVLRQEHAPGDKLFVDYAGHTVSITDRHTGATRETQIFVAVLGYSNDSHAEASLSQGAADWLGAHVRALTYFVRIPAIVNAISRTIVNSHVM